MRGILLLCLVTLAKGASVEANPGDWVGVEHCGSCHPDELKAWRAGPHARSWQSLGSRKGTGACESCHGTGPAPAGRNILANVQCEACHGAGGHYGSEDVMRDPALARALGLQTLASAEQRAAICLRCHTKASSLLSFEVEKAWALIKH